MNILAHQLLSMGDPDVMLGNFIADAVKGKRYESYAGGVRNGILLHRQIDTFTDTTTLNPESRVLLRQAYGKWTPVILDVVYDYMLTKFWSAYSEQTLPSFVEEVYCVLEERKNQMPDRMGEMFFYMRKYDWLSSYSTLDGIRLALQGLSRRVGSEVDMGGAVAVVESHMSHFETEFQSFFSALQEFSHDQYNQIVRQHG